MPSYGWFIVGFLAGGIIAGAAVTYAVWRALRILTLTVALSQAPRAELPSYPKGIN